MSDWRRFGGRTERGLGGTRRELGVPHIWSAIGDHGRWVTPTIKIRFFTFKYSFRVQKLENKK